MTTKVSLIKYKYTSRLVEQWKYLDVKLSLDEPLVSLYKYLTRNVDVATVTSMILHLPQVIPLPRMPVVISEGPVKNVILIQCKKKVENSSGVKLWSTPQSRSGLGLALWYFSSVRGIEKVKLVNDVGNADFCLYIGDRAREITLFENDVIDLGKEWFDVTKIPFVYAVTVGWRVTAFSFRPYSWNEISVIPLDDKVYGILENQVEILRDYWYKISFFPRGLLGLLLRSA